MKEEKKEKSLVRVIEGRTMTSSLDVAVTFGRQHKNVLQAIENLAVPDEFNRLNFQLSEYTDKTGRKLPFCWMSRDGFTVLVMGFTGARAMQFKLAYIDEFNRMEDYIRSHSENRLDQSEFFNRMHKLENTVARLYQMLSEEIPIQIYYYKENEIRCFILNEQPVLYAPDVIHVMDPEFAQTNFTNAPYALEKSGLVRDEHFIVSSIGKIAPHFGLTPDYILAKARLSDRTRGMTFVLPHGMNLLRIRNSEFYKWYCSTVMPTIPRLYNVYSERREALAITDVTLEKGGAC